MTLCLQKATREDCPAMGRILLNWVDETGWMPRIHPRDSYPVFAELLENISDVTVARIDGRVVGFIARQDNDIQALYVESAARGQGVGKALLDHAKSQVDKIGLWTFQANTAAQRFYRREGFREQRRTDGQGNDEKLPDVYMTWARTGDRTDHG